MAGRPGDADSAEQLDVADLDEEELKALAEVSKKGYYHGRPKSEAPPPPQRLQDAPSAATTAVGSPCRRTEFDDFQRKWDAFGKSGGEDASEAGASRSSPTRLASESPSIVPARAPVAPVAPDPTVVEQLVSMGFEAEESRAAAVTCRNRVDAAVEHLLGGGPTAASAARTTTAAADIGADPDKLAMLRDMGIPEQRARAALEASGNHLERAIEQATQGVGDASTESLRNARKSLPEIEAEVAKVQGAATLNAKQLKGLAETVLQVSCSLDAIDIEGEPALRSERRAELDRCNVLDERISRLLTSAELSTQTVSSEPIAGEHCSVEQQPQEPPTVAATEQSAEPMAASANAVQKVAPPIPDTGSDASAAAAVVEPSAAAERFEEAERLRFAGNEAFKAGDFSTASKHYHGALELDGENVAILSNLAAAELKCGDFTSAATHAAAANELSGGFSAKALFRQGQAMEGLGRPAEACEAYRRALEVEPGDRLVQQRLKECKAQL